ncbi:tyrosine-type recombinase/integrase [Flavobacterium sp. U410]
MSLKIVLSKKSKNDDFGFLQIQHIENGRKIKKSLGIKVDEFDFKKYWSVEFQKFSTKYKKSEEINEQIDDFLYKYKHHIDFKSNVDLKKLKNKKETDISFIKYFERLIELKLTVGHKNYLNNVLNKMKNFLKYTNRTDILIKDFDREFLQSFIVYCMTVKDPKCINYSTMTSYLKGIKVVYNDIINNDVYYFQGNIFKKLKFTDTEKPEKKSLTQEQLDNLSKLINSEHLNKEQKLTLQMFFFQIISNGMRVSDLLFLRWNNVKSHLIEYKMMKNQKRTIFSMTRLHFVILSELFDTKKYNEFINDDNCKTLISKEKIKSLNNYNFKDYEDFENRKYSLIELKELSKKNTFLKNQLTETIQEIEFNINQKLYMNTMKSILEHKIENGNQYIFLDKFSKKFSDYFKNYGQGNRLNENEYNEYKILRNLYNLRLRQIYKIYNKVYKVQQGENELFNTDWKIKLSSHVSRHTFTTLMIKNNINIYEVKDRLNHSTVTTTENYIKQFEIKDEHFKDDITRLIENKISFNI